MLLQQLQPPLLIMEFWIWIGLGRHQQDLGRVSFLLQCSGFSYELLMWIRRLFALRVSSNDGASLAPVGVEKWNRQTSSGSPKTGNDLQIRLHSTVGARTNRYFFRVVIPSRTPFLAPFNPTAATDDSDWGAHGRCVVGHSDSRYAS